MTYTSRMKKLILLLASRIQYVTECVSSTHKLDTSMPCSKMSYKITKRKVNCRQRNYKDIQNNHKEMQSDDIMTTKKHKNYRET